MSWAETLGALPPLGERRTAAGHVADALRAAIRTGAIGDGAELNQVALAEHFGVSRVPVREALRALEAEGWITARAHRRAFVQSLGIERVTEIFDIRTVLEVHLLAKTIGRLDADRIAKLHALCDAMDAMDDHVAWVGGNREFHRLLHEGAEAPLTVELVEGLGAQVERYLQLHGEGFDREREAGAEHRAILAAAVAGDVAAASGLLRAHIDHTRRRVVATITATLEGPTG
jgi:DNA-binding GntR family transcriptional regulator